MFSHSAIVPHEQQLRKGCSLGSTVHVENCPCSTALVGAETNKNQEQKGINKI